jgi:hypothetical protein
VTPLSLAAAAAGADGIIVEVHPHPEDAICDGRSSSTPTASPRTPSRWSAPRGRRQGVLLDARLMAVGPRRPVVAVVGVGLIGGSIGLAARERLGAEVRGWDPPPARSPRRAARRGRRGVRLAEEALAGAELAFVAAPVGALPARSARRSRPRARSAW